ncbi:C39 family peptidase [Candidatus Poribacteria bacterium]|nr:C39 family peptidase [Candidatus Poribacteria bacterium]
MRVRALWILAGFLLIVAGCSATGYQRIGNGHAHELSCEDISLSPGKDPACGPQALAQICKFWGIEVDEQDLLNQTLGDESDGSRLGTLREWAQGHGLEAQLYHGSPQDLAEKVAAGMPVIAVLDVNRYPELPNPLVRKNFWGHAVVVAGFDDESRQVILCDSGKTARMSYGSFFRDWKAAEWVTLLVWPGDTALSTETRLDPEAASRDLAR